MLRAPASGAARPPEPPTAAGAVQATTGQAPLQARALPLVLTATTGAARVVTMQTAAAAAAAAALGGGRLLAGWLDCDQGSVSEGVLAPRLPLRILWEELTE